MKDLSKFFKKRSKSISKAFSSEIIKISTIRLRNIERSIQEFSFKLTATDKDTFNTRPFQIKPLIDFFKKCLPQEENFTINIKVPKESEELYNSYCKTNSYKIVEEFISNAPIQILLQGITITLKTEVQNINLDNLQQIEALLNEKLKYVEKTKSEEQSQDTLQVEETENKNENVIKKGNKQDKQIVQGSSGYNIANNRKQITRAPVIVVAMHENFAWFRSFFHLPNSFNTAQFFSLQLPKFSIQSNNMPSGVIPALNQKEKEPVSATRITEDSTRNLVPQETERDIGQTRSHTDYFKANKKKKSKELSKEEKQSTIKQAQIDTRVAIVDSQIERRGKKLDEIFIEVMNGYKNQDPETSHNIFNSIFNIVYFQNKQLHEMLEPGEVLEILEILKRPQPSNNSLLGKEYLQKQVYRKKEQLLKLVSGIPIQSSPQLRNISHEILPSKVVDPLLKINKSTDITLKSPLKTVFSSKETYFCLFLVAASISVLCLWHFPSGMLKGLVPPEKREKIGLVLNIGLPILITLCVLSLVYFIYSEYKEYSIKSIEACDNRNRLPHLF